MPRDPMTEHLGFMAKLCDEIVDASAEKRPMKTLADIVVSDPHNFTGQRSATEPDELAEAHLFYDGPVPEPVRERILGGDLRQAIEAEGEAMFYRSMLDGRKKTIRLRLAEGLYARRPEWLTGDLAELRYCVRWWRKWRTLAAERRQEIERRLFSGRESYREAPTPFPSGSALLHEMEAARS